MCFFTPLDDPGPVCFNHVLTCGCLRLLDLSQVQQVFAEARVPRLRFHLELGMDGPRMADGSPFPAKHRRL